MAPIFEKLEFSFFPKSVLDFFYAALKKIKANRETTKLKNRVDFLQLMINSQKNNDLSKVENDKGLNDHEILSQAMIFLFAGYETTSSSLTFLAYNLARNPHVMKRLQEEVDATFPNKAPVEYQALMQMEYLDSVVNESLRLYPISTSGARGQGDCGDKWPCDSQRYGRHGTHVAPAPGPWSVARAGGVQTWEVQQGKQGDYWPVHVHAFRGRAKELHWDAICFGADETSSGGDPPDVQLLCV